MHAPVEVHVQQHGVLRLDGDAGGLLSAACRSSIEMSDFKGLCERSRHTASVKKFSSGICRSTRRPAWRRNAWARRRGYRHDRPSPAPSSRTRTCTPRPSRTSSWVEKVVMMTCGWFGSTCILCSMSRLRSIRIMGHSQLSGCPAEPPDSAVAIPLEAHLRTVTLAAAA